MENLVNSSFWRGKRVFLTGHTGFKGAWLAFWLADMGAVVYGYAQPPELPGSLFELLRLGQRIECSTFGDLRDSVQLTAAMQAANPEILFHLAAQALVPKGYHQPLETFSVNVMGTAHVLEIARSCEQLKAAIVVTSDKCYENREWPWGYRETDAMGGYDPYSASKGAAELVVASYRRSFLESQGVSVATARAGNVIGGGDNSPSRLIPDALSAFTAKTPLHLRNPSATRPWQHVLDPLHGYLQLAEKLHQFGQGWAQAWNFGPQGGDALTVEAVVRMVVEEWPYPVEWSADPSGSHLHEAQQLSLDCSKAFQQLGWRPVWDGRSALSKTVQWYLSTHTLARQTAEAACRQQLSEFLHAAGQSHS